MRQTVNVLRRNGRRKGQPVQSRAERDGSAEFRDAPGESPRRGDVWLATPPGVDGRPVGSDVLPCVVMRTPSPGESIVDCMLCFADDPGGAVLMVDSSGWGIGQPTSHLRADTGVRAVPTVALHSRMHELREDEVQDLEVRAALARAGRQRRAQQSNGGSGSRIRPTRSTDDPHEVLGVSPEATAEELRAAYRRMVWLTHPDVGGDREEFYRVTWAWRRLHP